MKRIHIVNPFLRPFGSSERKAIDLFEALKGMVKVQLWSCVPAHPLLAERAPIKRIRTSRLQQPFGGTLVIIGSYFPLGRWISLASPMRTVLYCDRPGGSQLQDRLHELRRARVRTVELLYASESLKGSVGIDGGVDVTPVAPKEFSSFVTTAPRSFTVGGLKVSQPQEKRGDESVFYKKLLRRGVDIVLMGASRQIVDEVGHAANVRLLQLGEIDSAEFLKSIDCFYHRRSDSAFDAGDRVVFEAMASGLPVVCGRDGTYADLIVQGVNGFLIDSEAEAEAIIVRLRASPDLRAAIGRAAHATLQEIWERDEGRMIRFYTGVDVCA